MIVTVTSIRLKSVWGYFKLTWLAMGIVKQTKIQAGFLEMKNRGFGYLHFTMTAWRSEADMQAFAHSGAHLEAMKSSPSLGQEFRFHTFESAEMPKWKEAEKALFEKGRVITFR